MSKKQYGPVEVEIPDWDKVKIKELRKSMGLSQFAFAVKHDIPIYSIQAWESGKRNPNMMSCLALQKISEAFEASKTVEGQQTGAWVSKTEDSKGKGWDLGG